VFGFEIFVALALIALIAFGAGALVARTRRAEPVTFANTTLTPDGANKHEESKPLFTALAAAIDDGLLVIEPDRRISFTNDNVRDLLGTSGAALAGQTLMVALRDFQADQAVELALTTGEPQTATLQVARTGRTLRLTCQPLEQSERRAVVVLRDMTQLAQLERARREMVANVSHELATPLASVRLLVETLMTDPPVEVRRRMLGQIDEELMEMTQLIDELRELSQIESGRMALKLGPAPVAEIVGRAIERLRPQAERRELTLQQELAPDLPRVLVDEDRIGQALINLLHNALKWTPEGGAITVKACIAAEATDQRTVQELSRVEGPGWVKLSVQDTGIGIPAGETERVFERFYKVDRARNRDAGGTGLGLAIAKHLVERHGGRIWVESREGAGSTFSLLLPVA
jgi:two-component system phosphate regulon sensor histidine kinase PhoR